ncbi:MULTISPECIES: hypothetical protein [unclassified Streptococcus]|uniref:hypothetical protein n=1 Tax=unclassified Streptococcus TaxID=2608887 RepID=UPI00211AED33|nr:MULTISPECIES: hypothetical protein [unclassified Streptococcus]MCQ9211842.1 hypothetical protein [Streptococcus sp. B01]MCQ9212872.1 hypothetical protein [Streptococcus sp. B01]MCQ9212963.1 hypothetical protein [Streptococcus sp. O1]MCQ9214988.1 hypothetical protein [Streptococcus sp. O1]
MKLIEKLKNFLGFDTVNREVSEMVSTELSAIANKEWKYIAQEKHEEVMLYQKMYNEVMLENHRLRKTIQTFEDMRKAEMGGF